MGENQVAEPRRETSSSVEPEAVAHNLLFVDDEPYILSALRRLFRTESDYHCHFAEGPAQALEILKDAPIEVVVCDHRMPQMEGADFLARLKKKRPNLVCIMLTGQASLNDVETALNEGDIYKFVLKPWDDDELKRLVASAVDKYSRDREQQIRSHAASESETRLKEDNRQLKESIEQRTDQLISALETARLANEKLLNGLHDIARAFSSILELSRPDIGTHARRVAGTVVDLAEAAELSAQERSEVEIAALLHDIGAIGLPAYLLERSRESYNANERTAYQTHPAAGAASLANIHGFAAIADYIAKHHERYDGSGFPVGLKANEIPLQSFLIGIADEHDHLIQRVTADSVLRFEQTYDTIRAMADNLFPQRVVNWMLKLMDRNRLSESSGGVREIGVHDLAPSMIIARNVYTIGGTLLAAADTLLDHRKILRIRSIDKFDSIVGRILIRAR